MKNFNYNSKTKEFISESEATKNPLEKGKFLIPANATKIKPLVAKENYTICFNEKLNKWEYKEDNREKTAYSTIDKSQSNISYIGEVKNDFTLLKPNENDLWNGTSWQIDIELLKSSKINSFKEKFSIYSNQHLRYKNVVYKGGESSASAIASAVNLAQALGETSTKIVDINDNENTLSFTETVELSVLLAKQWRENFFKYKSLKVQVANAVDSKAIKAIVWE